MPAAELRFEAVYYGVVSVLGLAFVAVRYDWGAPEVAAGAMIVVAAAVVALGLSARRPQVEGRTGRERTHRMFPLLMLLAVLIAAGGRVVAGVAAALLTGWALGALAGFLLARRAA